MDHFSQEIDVPNPDIHTSQSKSFLNQIHLRSIFLIATICTLNSAKHGLSLGLFEIYGGGLESSRGLFLILIPFLLLLVVWLMSSTLDFLFLSSAVWLLPSTGLGKFYLRYIAGNFRLSV